MDLALGIEFCLYKVGKCGRSSNIIMGCLVPHKELSQ